MLDMTSLTSRRTALQTVRLGIGEARRNLRIVLLVWIVFLALAWVAALPAWRWFDGVLSLAPEGDRLLSGLNVAVLRELTHYDRSPTRAVAMGSAFTFFVIALFLNPLVVGGTLGVLGVRDTRDVVLSGVTRTFVAEGVRSYWRFARILLIVGMLGVAVAMILMAGLEAIGGSFGERGFPRVSMWIDNMMVVAVAIVFGVSSLLVDVARVFMLRRDDGRAAGAVKQAIGFVWRNASAVLTIGVSFVVLLVVAVAIYNLLARGITPLSWGAIAFTIVWQQLFAITRTGLRVGLLAAIVALVDARVPRPAAAPDDVDVTSVSAEAPPLEEPVYELPTLG